MPDSVVTLEAHAGRAYPCQILSVLTYEGQAYALLVPWLDGVVAPGSGPAPVLMQIVEQDDQTILRQIECDDEFERVGAYVRRLVGGGAGSGG